MDQYSHNSCHHYCLILILVLVLTVSNIVTTTTTTTITGTVVSAFVPPTTTAITNQCMDRIDDHYKCHHLVQQQQQRNRLFLSSKTFLSSSSNNNNNNNNDEEDTGNDDGAQLAAAFFRTAQSKGINIDPSDLLLDDDDDDDDDEDEDEDDNTGSSLQDGSNPKAFVEEEIGGGKDGSISNDQLYSELKERVLESAGGFVSFVQGVTDDDDDDDENDDGDYVNETGRMQLLSSQNDQPYVVPTIVPDSELTAGEVVLLVLEALRNNNNPTINKGVEILFGYSSPGSQIKNEIGLTPTEYAEFLQETEYKVLFNNVGPIQIDKADYSFDGKKAFFTARLQPPDTTSTLETVSVNFILSTTGREDDACWLIDSILIRPQSMRRRRRK